MVRKYSWIGDNIPSEDFGGSSDILNQISSIGDMRTEDNEYIIMQKGAGSSASTRWIRCFWTGSAAWDSPGLRLRIYEEAAMTTFISEHRVIAGGYDIAWDTGDIGRIKLYFPDGDFPSLAASGNYCTLVRKDFVYKNPMDDSTQLGFLKMNKLMKYFDGDDYQATTLTTTQFMASSSNPDHWSMSSTKAYIGTYSFKCAPDVGHTQTYWDSVINDNVNIDLLNCNNHYISFRFYTDDADRADPRWFILQGSNLVGGGVSSVTSGTYYCSYDNGTWTATTIKRLDEQWVHVEIFIDEGTITIKINGTELYKLEGGRGRATYLRLEGDYNASGTPGADCIYFDDIYMESIPNPSPYYITSTLQVGTGRLSRWETYDSNYGGTIPSDEMRVRISSLDINDSPIDGLLGANYSAQEELTMTGIDSWVYRQIRIKTSIEWIKQYKDLDPTEDFYIYDWTVKYSRAPEAVSLICEQNSGIDYSDISPNSQIDTETTAITVWRGRYTEHSHPLFDFLFDFGDGSNSGWQSSEIFSHVFDRACETGYKDSYYPFFVAKDQYGGLSASGCAVNLNVWQTSNNLLRVLGDYSAYGQHKRAWIRTGAALDKFYHIESVAYSTGTTTFTLDDHYDLETDGVVANDIVDIIDALYGDFDGTNESFKVLSNKVETTAILRGRPIVAVSGSTIVFDASESFTPNGDESITYYYFDSDNSETSAGTSSSYSHMYDSAGTFNPTLYVRDSSITGAQKQSGTTSLTITIQTADEAGVPAIADVYDLKANLHNQPNDILKGHSREFQESEARVNDYPTYVDIRKKKQTFTMKGVAKPLKYYPGAGTTNLDAGELDIITLGTLWKNGTIFKYQYRSTRLSGTSDVKWFVGRIIDFTWHEIGGQPHHYEWTAECLYVHGIAGSDQEI